MIKILINIRKGKVLFIITIKNIKYPGINLRYRKKLYEETLKLLLSNIKEYLNKWKVIPCFLIERLNIVQILILAYSVNNMVQT